MQRQMQAGPGYLRLYLHAMGLFTKSKYSDAVREDAAVLFFDYHGIGRFAEKLTPEDSVTFLLEYHRAMGDVVFSTPATLIKYFGDQVLVVCGVPNAVAEPRGMAI